VDGTYSGLCLIPSVVVSSVEMSDPIMRKVLKIGSTDYSMFIYLALKIRERLYAGEFTLLCGKTESEEIYFKCCQLFVTFAYIIFFKLVLITNLMHNSFIL
jgi:hypothetical protein